MCTAHTPGHPSTADGIGQSATYMTLHILGDPSLRPGEFGLLMHSQMQREYWTMEHTQCYHTSTLSATTPQHSVLPHLNTHLNTQCYHTSTHNPPLPSPCAPSPSPPVPQMFGLYQDPEGANVFKKPDTALGTSTASDRATIETLRRRVRELETTLSRNVSGCSGSTWEWARAKYS